MEPTKGDCSDTGAPCIFDQGCVDLGGVTCTSEGDCLDASGILLGHCSADISCEESSCEQSDQFRLIFTPDTNWVAYKISSSNPGQTFYNIMYDALSATGDVTLFVTIPYPYVTQGARPFHVYDAETVGSSGSGCLDPESSILSASVTITMDDWINGADGTNARNYNLACDQVTGPDGSGFCTFEFTIPQNKLPDTASRMVYANIHLDYGLKGSSLDVNPAGDGKEDSYDRENHISPWGSSDALVDTDTNNGPLGLTDCRDYWFDHSDDTGLLFEDHVQNLNIFKRVVIGTHGRVFCADTDAGFEDYFVQLVHPYNDTVSINKVDSEGYYALQYSHRGKPTVYTVEVHDAEGLVITQDVELQGGSGMIQINFSATDCEPPHTPDEYVWSSTVKYLKGNNKNSK